MTGWLRATTFVTRNVPPLIVRPLLLARGVLAEMARTPPLIVVSPVYPVGARQGQGAGAGLGQAARTSDRLRDRRVEAVGVEGAAAATQCYRACGGEVEGRKVPQRAAIEGQVAGAQPRVAADRQGSTTPDSGAARVGIGACRSHRPGPSIVSLPVSSIAPPNVVVAPFSENVPPKLVT